MTIEQFVQDNVSILKDERNGVYRHEKRTFPNSDAKLLSIFPKKDSKVYKQSGWVLVSVEVPEGVKSKSVDSPSTGSNAKAEIEGLETKLEEALTAKTESDNQVAALKSQLEASTATLSNAKAEIEGLTKKNSALEAEIVELNKQGEQAKEASKQEKPAAKAKPSKN